MKTGKWYCSTVDDRVAMHKKKSKTLQSKTIIAEKHGKKIPGKRKQRWSASGKMSGADASAGFGARTQEPWAWFRRESLDHL
ncbi:Hypothetical protein SMAX5B_010215 [Scophthalmus maximus]|uniref:Uncharacterized protein n=1 Tax=Scophthalmus maximus TaxID=52904 RepID=A0A2U9B607_SCOMX|nr:Hypothetical protein SMAX5B_010215 [Scophthalmus maximus]